MSEIEKMYENAQVERMLDCQHYMMGDDWTNDKCCIDKGQGAYSDDCNWGYNSDYNEQDRLKCPYCQVEDYGYPPFNADRQVRLIKWLIASGDCYFTITIKPDEFEECLAKYINNMWKDLADIDKEQIKEILK